MDTMELKRNRHYNMDMFPWAGKLERRAMMHPPNEIFLGIKDVKSYEGRGQCGSCATHIGSGKTQWYDRKLGSKQAGSGLISDSIKKVIPKIKRISKKPLKLVEMPAQRRLIPKLNESNVSHEDDTLLPHERLKYAMLKNKRKKLGKILSGVNLK